MYDDIVVDPCHDAVAAFLDELWEGVHDVLDVCCGTGLLAAELIALGYRVVGVDASQDMLDQARRRLGSDAPLVLATLPDLEVDGVFDAAVCTLDGITYLTPEELPPAAVSVATRLRPGGWLVFDVHTEAMMAFTSSRPFVSGEKEGHRFVMSASVDADARVCDTRIDFEPAGSGSPFSESHRQFFHRAADIRSTLVDAGFEVVAVRDEYSDRPADESTLTATWIARLRP